MTTWPLVNRHYTSHEEANDRPVWLAASLLAANIKPCHLWDWYHRNSQHCPSALFTAGFVTRRRAFVPFRSVPPRVSSRSGKGAHGAIFPSVGVFFAGRDEKDRKAWPSEARTARSRKYRISCAAAWRRTTCLLDVEQCGMTLLAQRSLRDRR